LNLFWRFTHNSAIAGLLVQQSSNEGEGLVTDRTPLWIGDNTDHWQGG